ncbi:MAG: AMP-binding protein, partial [Bdellovibrionales bacterium]|nr:AMP-binding protein [Bdellovibrionales bacterium]
MNLMQPVLPIFEKYQDKVAIISSSGRQITYGEFDQKVQRAICYLELQGVKRGSKILLFIPVDLELYILIAAIFRLGAIVVFIDPWAGKDYTNAALAKVCPDLLISIPKALLLLLTVQKLRKIPSRISLSKIVRYCDDSANLGSNHLEEVPKNHTALITFTTGSSNNPKGFDRTHGFLQAQHEAHEHYFGHDSSDIDLCMFPIFVLSNLGSGMTSVIANVDLRNIGGVNPQDIVDQINRHQITSLTCSPALVKPLASYCCDQKITLPSLKKFFTGGAPVDPMLFESLEQVFTSASMLLVYGSTEAEPIAIMDSKEVIQQAKMMTFAGKGVALGRVVDRLNYHLVTPTDLPLDKIDPIAKGEVGEIILSGSFVGTRYFQDPDAFRQNKIVDSGGTIWHRTGDLAIEHEDSILYMQGR